MKLINFIGLVILLSNFMAQASTELPFTPYSFALDLKCTHYLRTAELGDLEPNRHSYTQSVVLVPGQSMQIAMPGIDGLRHTYVFSLNPQDSGYIQGQDKFRKTLYGLGYLLNVTRLDESDWPQIEKKYYFVGSKSQSLKFSVMTNGDVRTSAWQLTPKYNRSTEKMEFTYEPSLTDTLPENIEMIWSVGLKGPRQSVILSEGPISFGKAVDASLQKPKPFASKLVQDVILNIQIQLHSKP